MKKKTGAFTKKFATAIAVAAIVVFLVYAISIKAPAANMLTENKTLEQTTSTLTPENSTACITSTEKRTVRGNSMTRIFSDGDATTVQFGYYACNAPQKGEIALVHFAGDANPLIKIIKATSGDSFSLSQTGCGWNIIVNGQILQNSEGAQYCIGYSGYRMLSLYANSYGGVIPQEAYLVLGNLVGGSTDSTRFGLVSRDSLLGKVKIPASSTYNN